MCLSVCPQAYLRNHWTNPHRTFCADPLWPWLGPPLTATLCTSGFMDDATFGRNGREAGKGLAAFSVISQLRVRPGRSLMSMNACFLICTAQYHSLSPAVADVCRWSADTLHCIHCLPHFLCSSVFCLWFFFVTSLSASVCYTGLALHQCTTLMHSMSCVFR